MQLGSGLTLDLAKKKIECYLNQGVVQLYFMKLVRNLNYQLFLSFEYALLML